MDPDASSDVKSRLAELEQLQADLVFNCAHRLRSPLTVLRAHAELLATGDLPAEARDSVSAILEAAHQLKHLTDGLVDQLRDHAGGAEPALRRWLAEDTHDLPGARFRRGGT